MGLFFEFGAEYLYLVVPFAALLIFIKLPGNMRRKMLLNGILTLPFSYIVALVARATYYNPSPVDPFENGFPSDHTLLVAAIASVVWFYNKKVGSVLWVVVILVGISRVYVGEHHVVDVVASMVIAFSIACLAEGITKKINH